LHDIEALVARLASKHEVIVSHYAHAGDFFYDLASRVSGIILPGAVSMIPTTRKGGSRDPIKGGWLDYMDVRR